MPISADTATIAAFVSCRFMIRLLCIATTRIGLDEARPANARPASRRAESCAECAHPDHTPLCKRVYGKCYTAQSHTNMTIRQYSYTHIGTAARSRGRIDTYLLVTDRSLSDGAGRIPIVA